MHSFMTTIPRALLAATSMCLTTSAYANGLEAPASASGRYAGIGGAGASSVSGADAVLLNPAGLARAGGLSVVLNASPVFSQTEVPLLAPNTPQGSERTVGPMAEVLAAYSLIPGLAVGAGLNVAGGLGSDYGAIAIAPFQSDPRIAQQMGALEATIGAGAQLTPAFSLGAAWRASYIMGELHTVVPLPGGMLQALHVTGASGTTFSGFRFGAQLRDPGEVWGLGLVVRTPVTWELTGTAAADFAAPAGAPPPMELGEATLAMTFPLQIAAGADLELFTGGRAFAQYSYSQYSVNEMQPFTLGGQTTETVIDWQDRHSLHLGAEVAVVEELKIRGGYILESAVIPAERPSVYAPLGVGHTFALGTGASFGEHFGADLAFLYSISGAAARPAVGAAGLPGDYDSNAFVLAVSLAYRR
jgi:long-subunit fatty acid transport protein